MLNATPRKIKPFLRWAGGKQWLSDRLVRLIPKTDHTYFEPFLGGGSLFFAARPSKAVLGDINEQLIETYRVLRDHPKQLILILSKWKNEKETYYKIRAKQYRSPRWRAARSIYLNKTCWNGLYRVNRKGRFNVPFGNHNRRVFDEAHLLEVSEALHGIELACSDFEILLDQASNGDFVYLDPPYTVLHSRNGFRQYNERLFSWQDQIRLASLANDLVNRGCEVVVSNADNEEVRDLYHEFHYQTISRHSVLAANSKWRRKTREALFISSKELLIEFNQD